MAKATRPGKMSVDHLRNARGATSILPFSTRARAGATVSVPLAWNELTADLHADQFNIRNLPTRLASLKRDPWEGFKSVRQSPRPIEQSHLVGSLT